MRVEERHLQAAHDQLDGFTKIHGSDPEDEPSDALSEAMALTREGSDALVRYVTGDFTAHLASLERDFGPEDVATFYATGIYTGLLAAQDARVEELAELGEERAALRRLVETVRPFLRLAENPDVAIDSAEIGAAWKAYDDAREIVAERES